jgi:hypothetical protein
MLQGWTRYIALRTVVAHAETHPGPSQEKIESRHDRKTKDLRVRVRRSKHTAASCCANQLWYRTFADGDDMLGLWVVHGLCDRDGVLLKVEGRIRRLEELFSEDGMSFARGGVLTRSFHSKATYIRSIYGERSCAVVRTKAQGDQQFTHWHIDVHALASLICQGELQEAIVGIMITEEQWLGRVDIPLFGYLHLVIDIRYLV